MRSQLLPAFSLFAAALAMNPLSAEDPKQVYRARELASDGGNLLFRYLEPPSIDSGKTYPLVVFLHGAGERGDDNTEQLVHGLKEFITPESRARYPCFIIAPQCPEEKRWVEVDWTLDSHTMPDEPSESLTLTFALIDKMVMEQPIDRSRIYITGLSMGGFGTWDAISRRPDLFAAAVPICGGGDEQQAKRLTDIPIWAFHGDQDTTVKPERSVNMIEAIRQAGGNAKLTMYEGVGHDSWSRTYADPEMLKWLFSQRMPASSDRQ